MWGIGRFGESCKKGHGRIVQHDKINLRARSIEGLHLYRFVQGLESSSVASASHIGFSEDFPIEAIKRINLEEGIISQR